METVLGVKISNSGREINISPTSFGLTDIDATIPIPDGWLEISVHDGKVEWNAPSNVTVTAHSIK